MNDKKIMMRRQKLINKQYLVLKYN